MKKILLLLVLASFFQNSFAQEGKAPSKNGAREETTREIETTVITLDLSTPNPTSLKHSGKENKLVVSNKNPLAFNLINGNPYRFKYVLNFKKINLFTNITFNPTIDDLKKNGDPGDNGIIEGQADIDGDGIDDSQDECPNEAGPLITNGCPLEDGQNLEQLVLEKLKTTEKSIKDLKSKIDTYITEISNLPTLDMKGFNSKTKEFKEEFITIIEQNTENENIIEIENLTGDSVTKSQNEINELIEGVRLSIEKLISTKTSSYLLPIDINGDNIDFIEVQLDIFQGESEKPETYKYKIWIKGGLKIDVSGGFHLTSVFDSEYFTSDAENGEKFINRKDNGNYDFGFGSMVNLSLRGGSWVRPTLNVGALFTANQKFQVLTGLGFILGKNERFIFHTGLAMGRVNVLRNTFDDNGETSYDLGTDGIIPIDEKFKFGHFFGVTYNFTKTKSDKD